MADLDAYVSSHRGDHEASKERNGLVTAVHACPHSAEAWKAMLAYEEAHNSNSTQQQSLAADPSRVSLYHLYYYATQLVPRNKNQHKEAYLQLWLGFARQQWCVTAGERSRTGTGSDVRAAFGKLAASSTGTRPASMMPARLLSGCDWSMCCMQGAQPGRCKGHL